MTHEIDVEYVPVCAVCWEPVQLTEADDGTFEHVLRGQGRHTQPSEPPVVQGPPGGSP